jgi:hypothetical protein
MRIALSVFAFLAVLIQPSLRGQPSVRLLRPGTFLVEPPQILPTEQWFGLHRTASGWSLTRVAPKITAAQPVCGDRATLISVDGSNDMLILLTGVRNLSEGPVTAAIDRPRFVYPGEVIDIGAGIAGRAERPRFHLEALGRAVREVGGVVFENYTLWITHGRERQRVASFPRNGLDNPRQVMWAGDIDRDARPDVLFNFPLGDAGANYVLFLSSLRAADQFVSESASFSNPAC